MRRWRIERVDADRYQIALAVAGYAPDEIAVTAEKKIVTVEGNMAEDGSCEFLCRGDCSPAVQTTS